MFVTIKFCYLFNNEKIACFITYQIYCTFVNEWKINENPYIDDGKHLFDAVSVRRCSLTVIELLNALTVIKSINSKRFKNQFSMIDRLVYIISNYAVRFYS